MFARFLAILNSFYLKNVRAVIAESLLLANCLLTAILSA
jgi:hypothetical protein